MQTAHSEEPVCTQDSIENEQFFRNIHNLDNFTAAKSDDSHVFVLPGNKRSGCYPKFPETGRRWYRWPVGCPFSQNLSNNAESLIATRLSVITQIPVPFPYFEHNSRESFGSHGMPRQLPPVVEEEEESREEKVVENGIAAVANQCCTLRSSSVEAVKSDWRGEAMLPCRTTRSEGCAPRRSERTRQTADSMVPQ